MVGTLKKKKRFPALASSMVITICLDNWVIKSLSLLPFMCVVVFPAWKFREVLVSCPLKVNHKVGKRVVRELLYDYGCLCTASCSGVAFIIGPSALVIFLSLQIQSFWYIFFLNMLMFMIQLSHSLKGQQHAIVPFCTPIVKRDI